MNNSKNIYKPTIITHGDGDGVFSAALVVAGGISNWEVVFSQPFLLPKMADLKNETIVVDMAVDNKNPTAFLEWVKRNEGFILQWIDHHDGAEELLRPILGDRLVCGEAPSCAMLLTNRMYIVPEWVDAANACDRPTEFASTDLSVRYNSAFKVSLVRLQVGEKGIVEKVQQAFFQELISGIESKLVSTLAGEYPALEKKTNEAVDSLTDLTNFNKEVGLVKIESQSSVDVTQVMVRGYKKYPTIVIETVSAEDGQSIVLVGTSKKPDEIDLVKVFELGSGNSSRVVLTGEKANMDYVILKFGCTCICCKCPHTKGVSSECNYCAGMQ